MHSTPSVVDTDRFSLDTESGFKDVVFVTSAYGLGETVVGGTVNPDEWCLGGLNSVSYTSRFGSWNSDG